MHTTTRAHRRMVKKLQKNGVTGRSCHDSERGGGTSSFATREAPNAVPTDINDADLEPHARPTEKVSS